MRKDYIYVTNSINISCVFIEAASVMQVALLVAEGLRLCGLVHTNILPPMAACAEEACRPLLVYCCASHSSNLKRYY